MQPDATITFSFWTAASVLPDDAVEIGVRDGGAQARLSIASGGVQRVGEDVAVATLRPAEALGAAAVGALRFRLVRGAVAGDWQPLVQVARLPALDRLACPAEGKDCILSGARLFLIASIADTPDAARPLILPAGFVGSQITLPQPAGASLYLRLRDAPTATVRVDMRTGETADRG